MRQKDRIVSKALRALSVLLLAGITSSAQDFQIRTRVDLVVVPVTVKGSGDQLISGLSEENFMIFEDGHQQKLSNFTIDPVPLSAAVLLDTGLTATSFIKVQKALPALAGSFSDFDEVAVYRFNKFVTQLADFSKDKSVVEKALNKINDIEPSSPSVSSAPFANSTPVFNGLPVIAPSLGTGGRPTPAKASKVLHDAMFTAANDLAKRPRERRRVVLIVTDGLSSGNDHSFDQAVAQLLEQNIQVYSLGMDAAFLARKTSILDDYSKATGGDIFYVDTQDKLERSYNQAMDEARNQYVLGYFSTNKVQGSLPVFRQIVVKTDRPGLETIHRKGYYQYP
jgi:von Willebrand factor type A domain.